MATIILGAQGKLGSVLHRYALREGWGWLSQGRRSGADIRWSGDLLAPAAKEIFAEGATVINMIGVTQGDAAQLHSGNVTFVEHLLTRAADTGVSHLVLASSAAVYGSQNAPLCEDTPLAPITDYGTSKARMEDAVHTFMGTNRNLAVTVLRIGNVAGSDALTPLAQKAARDRTPMTLHQFENGAPAIRPYIGPRDLAHCIKALTKTPSGLRILNVAAPRAVELGLILSGYRDHLLPDLTWTHAPAPSGIPARVILKTDRLGEFVDLETVTSIPAQMAKQVAEDRTT